MAVLQTNKKLAGLLTGAATFVAVSATLAGKKPLSPLTSSSTAEESGLLVPIPICEKRDVEKAGISNKSNKSFFICIFFKIANLKHNE